MSAIQEVMVRYNELWKPGGLSDVARVLDPEFARHGASGEFVGIRAFEDYVRHFSRGLSNLLFVALDWAPANEKCFVRYRFKGKHDGPLYGAPPSGRLIDVEGVALYRIRGSALLELWDYMDLLELARQLGVPPGSLEWRASRRQEDPEFAQDAKWTAARGMASK